MADHCEGLRPKLHFHFLKLLGPLSCRRLSQQLLCEGGIHPGQVVSLSQGPWSWSDRASYTGCSFSAGQPAAQSPAELASRQEETQQWDWEAACSGLLTFMIFIFMFIETVIKRPSGLILIFISPLLD